MDEYVKTTLPEPSHFYYLSYLSALPWTLERYHSLGIPEEIFDHTITQLPFLFLEKHDVTGRWVFVGFCWIWRLLSCDLFRLGRIQYMAIPYNRAEKVFRNNKDGSLVMLCDPDMELRADGWANGAGGNADPEPWKGKYEETEEYWLGNPVHRKGYVLKAPVKLKKGQWELALQQGDCVLDMHIPQDGAFTPSQCRASVAMAEEFFARYFPDVHFKGLHCHTWLFTAQLEEFLPKGSNILEFRNEFHLMPSAGNIEFLWGFVFGEGYTRENAPRDTTLRRAVMEHIDRGGEVFDLAGVALQGSKGWGE